MRLTPKEMEKLMLHTAGNLAKERRARGLKLNYTEAMAYISSELMEMARDGKRVTELMGIRPQAPHERRCHGWRSRYDFCCPSRSDLPRWDEARYCT